MSIESQRLIRCIVSRDKMDKTRVASIVKRVQHPAFKKFVQKTTKVVFHDENNTTKVGDEVLVYQTRPKSAKKRFAFHSTVNDSN